MEQLTFLDICAGIGGFRLGLEAAGHKCIGYCEYDKFARASYEAMYNTEGEWKADDVTKLKSREIPYADIWCFGFPCQDITIAGKRRGLCGKRSGIYYCIIDLIKGKEEGDKPAYLLVENVKNLLSIHAGFDFAAVLSEMDEAGYDCRWQVLNSKDYGVPQNRERVFIVANLRSRGGREILPVSGESAEIGIQVIEGVGEEQVVRVFVDQTLNHPKITMLARCLISSYKTGFTTWGTNSGVLEILEFKKPDCPEKWQKGKMMDCQMGTVLKCGRIRRLTPRECFRLQGFPDELYERAASVSSETQLYKQAGNAVTVTAAFAVAMMLPESREQSCKEE